MHVTTDTCCGDCQTQVRASRATLFCSPAHAYLQVACKVARPSVWGMHNMRGAVACTSISSRCLLACDHRPQTQAPTSKSSKKPSTVNQTSVRNTSSPTTVGSKGGTGVKTSKPTKHPTVNQTSVRNTSSPTTAGSKGGTGVKTSKPTKNRRLQKSTSKPTLKPTSNSTVLTSSKGGGADPFGCCMSYSVGTGHGKGPSKYKRHVAKSKCPTRTSSMEGGVQRLQIWLKKCTPGKGQTWGGLTQH